VGPAQLLLPRATDDAVAGAASSTHAHRPGIPSSPRNGAALPPSSLPTHPSVSPPHRTGRSALMPPPPAARSPSSSGRPAPPSDPKKGRGARPSSVHSSPPPHRASPLPFALHRRWPRLIIESATEALGEDARSSSPFSPTRGELQGSAAPVSHAPVSAPPYPGRESTVDRPPLRGP
jgi:hypothetical protein